MLLAAQPAPQPSHVAQAVVPADLITLRKPTTSAELLWLLKLAHLVISDVGRTMEETFAPAQPAVAAPQQEAQEPVNGWSVEATIYKRRDEWVLELSGTINDCAFTCRHTQPGYLQPEDVAGLPSLYSEGTAPQPSTAPLSEMPYEKRKAIQEGEQISASDAWFKARHEMLDTVDRRNVFRAGFDRGWSAALAAQGGKP